MLLSQVGHTKHVNNWNYKLAGQHEVLTHVFQTDDGALPQDKKVFPREKNDSIDEAESLERHERKLSRGER